MNQMAVRHSVGVVAYRPVAYSRVGWMWRVLKVSRVCMWEHGAIICIF